MAHLAVSFTTNSASLERVGQGHMKESSPRSSSFSRGERRVEVEGSLTIVPRAVLVPSNSGHMGGHAPLPEGLRT